VWQEAGQQGTARSDNALNFGGALRNTRHRVRLAAPFMWGARVPHDTRASNKAVRPRPPESQWLSSLCTVGAHTRLPARPSQSSRGLSPQLSTFK